MIEFIRQNWYWALIPVQIFISYKILSLLWEIMESGKKSDR